MNLRKVSDMIFLAEENAKYLKALLAEFPTARRVDIHGKVVYAAALTPDQFVGLDFEVQPGFAVPYGCGDALYSKHIYSDEHLIKEWLRWPIKRVFNLLPPEEMKKLYARLVNTTPRMGLD